MNNAYFSNIRSQIIYYLQNAKEEIKIAMAWFTSPELFNEIISCLNKGIQIELVLLDDAINYHPYAPDFNIFIKKGGILRTARVNPRFMHHKFCIVDKTVVITGSYNWTYYAENRNIENILISKDSTTINEYILEFKRLQNLYPICNKSERISWDDISQRPNIDIEILNYELSCISKAQKLPEQKVFKSNTTIEMVEKRYNPKAAYHIGIQGDNDEMINIVNNGTPLPYTNSLIMYNYPDNRKNVVARIVYGNKSKASENWLLLDEKINELVSDAPNSEIVIAFNITITANGYLEIEIRCKETGKAIVLTKTNTDLVYYDEE